METPQWWWMQDDEYTIDQPIPPGLDDLAGPNGIALVKAFEDGRTQPGWGLKSHQPGQPGFMPRYQRQEFRARKALASYDAGRTAFAFVMRSVRAICVDIDGKNGGVEHAAEFLGNAPYTLAETSKSGTGFHLYYSTAEIWDPELGFAIYDDGISVVTGVDVRATGCVYHHPQQRWNNRPIAPLPQWIADRLASKKQWKIKRMAQIAAIGDEGEDDMETLMTHEELLEELKKPIPEGKRNNSLFAIGSQLMQAKVPDWETKLEDRADELGLEAEEISKLISNIRRYGA